MHYEYRVGEETVRLEVDPSVVAVRFDQTSRSNIDKAIKSADVGTPNAGFDMVGDQFVLLPALGTQTFAATRVEDMVAAKLESLRAQDVVIDARPVFKLAEARAIATDQLIIGVEPGEDVRELLERQSLVEVSREEERLVARLPEGADPFAFLERVEAEDQVLYVEPKFLLIGEARPSRAVDLLEVNAATSANRYAMEITRARAAWAIQAGNPAIRIAILDEGVDSAHPDLAPAVVGTFDATDGNAYQEPNVWDGHGTACAGLAVASPSAASGDAGMSGSGRGCSLLAVRIAFSRRKGAPWETSQDIIATAIDWSWRNGASVISNSWGQGLPSNAVIHAVERARVQGRGGRGAVFVAAAGNNEGAVSFPANGQHVLTVAASNQFDQCKTRGSADGETYWGSCFGPQVDIAAPGVLNYTTDNRGAGGYSPSDYAPAFNGTSAATPIVAGACGLLLSKRPELTEAQVREAICRSATKVGQFPYHNGRNDRMGFGRLDVVAALALV
ncbi:S8 family serine peptidase [Sphingomonas sp. J344]|uniref:S8 family serine peptidase n=1 Tax=Sphingomonas sp. J344 TaxID=2898434 RepID=UPI002150917B|nr:S8 family serine peptidase [Sphingomonas sp. J344]MCR5869470.1 S8 family serine peptidase [Sphingomonas sp. J344]